MYNMYPFKIIRDYKLLMISTYEHNICINMNIFANLFRFRVSMGHGRRRIALLRIFPDGNVGEKR